MQIKLGGAPDPHQLEELQKHYSHPARGIHWDMGVGKSRVIVDTVSVQHQRGRLHAALIIAPKSVLSSWRYEIETHLHHDITREVVVWGASDFTRYANKALHRFDTEGHRALRFLVINHDALITVRGRTYVQSWLAANSPIFLCVDESTSIKNHRAKRTQAVVTLARDSRVVAKRIMSGLPAPKSPLDLWSQYQVIEASPFGHRSFYTFRNMYGIVKRMQLKSGRAFDQVVGYRNLDDLMEKVNQRASRLRKEDVLTLPPKRYLRREVDLTLEQARAYRSMKTLAIAALGDLETSGVATAPAAMTRILRLHQIVCGLLQTDEELEPTPLPSNRLATLLEILAESDEKTIIWATYKASIREIRHALIEAYGPDSTVVMYGPTTPTERADAIERFQNDPACRYFVATPSTGGIGITLTAASMVIYYSSSYNLEHRLQSEDRAHRRGQTKSVTYIDIVCPKTIDEIILGALRNKIDLSAAIMRDGWRKWVI